MNFKFLENKKGFTLVELVIVIVIVGILSIVAVPIYRGYTRKAMLTEGKSIIANIENSEKIYYAENSFFYSTQKKSFDKVLDVDVRSNKYFRSFEITAEEKSFVATTSGTGIASGMSLTLIFDSIKKKSKLISDGIQD